MIKARLLCLIPLSLLSCGKKPPAAPAGDAELTALVKSAMDLSADPCVDFYRYACGAWMDGTEIPGDESAWYRSFSEIDKRNEALLRTMMEEAVAAPQNDIERKVGAVYGACMAEDAIEAAGLEPMRAELARIDAIADIAGLSPVIGHLQLLGVNPLFTAGVFPDFTDPNLQILHMSQGGLGLPDRDYYLREGDDAQATRDAYMAHIAKMLQLSGEAEAQAQAHAKAVFAFELELAKLSVPRAELRDPEKTYHKIDRDGVQKLAPQLDWGKVFAEAGVPNLKDINVEVPDFYQGLGLQLAKTDMDTVRAYLRFHTLSTFAAHLPRALQEEDFAFYGKTLSGQQEMKPRWKRCVNFTQTALGESVGQLYVARAFAGDSKEIALELIHGIEEAFGENLTSLAWMDDETRQRALEKRGTLINKIGYPDKWRDYSALEVTTDDHFTNMVRSIAFESAFQLQKVGNPVDKGEWYMPPQVVNAYYNPLANEMVFPAGILQPPFFDRDYPSAMNFGAIGMVMGHELTHGFDDTGRKFDAQGRMVTWWNEGAIQRFEEQAQCVVDQYSGFAVRDGLNVNGELTLGENIADLGGLKESYVAWQAHVAKHGPDARTVDGLTQDQLFFVAFAQGWCAEVMPEYEQMLVTVDTHSPARFRVLGPAMNTPAFGAAFNCPVGAPMRPAEPCEVW